MHDKNSKSKVYRPKILIVFNIHDRPLAEKLSAILKVGKVIDRSSAGHVLLQILAKEEVLKIINLINGRMRTPNFFYCRFALKRKYYRYRGQYKKKKYGSIFFFINKKDKNPPLPPPPGGGQGGGGARGLF